MVSRSETESMPAWLDEHHASLNRAARACYALRNATDNPARALDYEDMGDVYYARAIAIVEEWTA